MFKEFKEFAMRGNVVDMAAFGSIVKSLVADVIMPPIGLLLGGVDFSNIFITLSGGDYESLAEAQEAGAATINIGIFFNQVISFLIVAFAVFLLIKGINSMKKRRPRSQPPRNVPTASAAFPLRRRAAGTAPPNFEMFSIG